MIKKYSYSPNRFNLINFQKIKNIELKTKDKMKKKEEDKELSNRYFMPKLNFHQQMIEKLRKHSRSNKSFDQKQLKEYYSPKYYPNFGKIPI